MAFNRDSSLRYLPRERGLGMAGLSDDTTHLVLVNNVESTRSAELTWPSTRARDSAKDIRFSGSGTNGTAVLLTELRSGSLIHVST